MFPSLALPRFVKRGLGFDESITGDVSLGLWSYVPRCWATIVLQEHTNRFLDHIVTRNGKALAANHQGPKRKFIQNLHKLMGSQRRISAIEDAERRLLCQEAPKPFRLRIHDRCERFCNPGKLATPAKDGSGRKPRYVEIADD